MSKHLIPKLGATFKNVTLTFNKGGQSKGERAVHTVTSFKKNIRTVTDLYKLIESVNPN